MFEDEIIYFHFNLGGVWIYNHWKRSYSWPNPTTWKLEKAQFPKVTHSNAGPWALVLAIDWYANPLSHHGLVASCTHFHLVHFSVPASLSFFWCCFLKSKLVQFGPTPKEPGKVIGKLMTHFGRVSFWQLMDKDRLVNSFGRRSTHSTFFIFPTFQKYLFHLCIPIFTNREV